MHYVACYSSIIDSFFSYLTAASGRGGTRVPTIPPPLPRRWQKATGGQQTRWAMRTRTLLPDGTPTPHAWDRTGTHRFATTTPLPDHTTVYHTSLCHSPVIGYNSSAPYSPPTRWRATLHTTTPARLGVLRLSLPHPFPRRTRGLDRRDWTWCRRAVTSLRD